MLIGLNGVSRSGKDTIADYLVERYGFKRYSFAGKLRELALAVDPVIELDVEPHKLLFGQYCRLSVVIDVLGYESAKSNKDVRRFYQNLGGGCRSVFGEDFWVKEMKKVFNERGWNSHTHLVGTDTRYDNEAEFIHSIGGYNIKVIKPDAPKVNSHSSESGISGHLLDGRLNNIGTIEQLYEGVADMLMFLGYKERK